MDVAELAQAFADPKQDKHFEIVQRVQELMGQGVDVSSLFLPMISSASTRDIPTKKAAFHFLRTYGYQNEELCILGINTLHQDSTDPDPVVRALALRTLCSLGQRNVLRFMLQPLYKGLRDKNAHVRKTAVMGCVSIFELDPLFVLESDIVDRLYRLIRDRDGQVAVNAILALETILQDEGGLVLNQTMARYLLGRFNDLTSGQLVVVLGILCRYRPETDEEIYDIMNDIDEGLQHVSVAVQMATLRLFIWQTQNLNEIQEQVLQTIFETLTKQLLSVQPEIVYASLDHLKLMVQRSVSFYEKDVSTIEIVFCRQEDPTAIKDAKIRLLGEIVTRTSNPNVVKIIIQELLRYATLQYHKSGSASRNASNKTRHANPHQQQRYDRHLPHATESQVATACRAIHVLGTLGASKAAFSKPAAQASRASTESTVLSSLTPAAGSGLDKKDQVDAWKLVVDALFEAIAYVSGLDMAATATSTESSSACKPPALQLKDQDVERVLSAIVLAIEACWQARFNVQQATGTLCEAGGGGLLSALQVKAFGSILLRYLDQEELDRQAKKNKPLRTSYQHSPSPIGGGGVGLDATMSSLSLSSSTATIQPEEEGDDLEHTIGGLSNLARIAGIRILMLEEAIAQRYLKRQMQVVGAKGTAESQQQQRWQAKWDKGREMREVYATLLQQQVQEMVQVVAWQCRQQRKRRRRAGGVSSSFAGGGGGGGGGGAWASKVGDAGGQSQAAKEFEARRTFHLAVLQLACCLVATGLDADFKTWRSQDKNRGGGGCEEGGSDSLDFVGSSGTTAPAGAEQTSGSSGASSSYRKTVLERRMSILELLLETLLTPEEDHIPKEAGAVGLVLKSVSRDVKDRARWIRQQYYVPFKAMMDQVPSQESGAPSLKSSAPSSPFLAAEAFVQLYGIPEFSGQERRIEPRQENHVSEGEQHGPINLAELESQDRLVQHGFNTLSIHML